jgi:hypothetical protein
MEMCFFLSFFCVRNMFLETLYCLLSRKNPKDASENKLILHHMENSASSVKSCMQMLSGCH